MCQRRQKSVIDTARVRPVEVLREPEAEHPRQADRHVAVAGEVEVDLDRVRQRADPRAGRASSPDGVPNAASATGPTWSAISTFLDSPSAKRGKPSAKSSKPLAARRRTADLVVDLVVADDRPGDQLREERHVLRVVGDPPHRRRLPARDVDHVRDRVEREERDPDRQQDRRHRRHVAVAEQRPAVELSCCTANTVYFQVNRIEQVDHDRRPHRGRRARSSRPTGLEPADRPPRDDSSARC